MAAIRAGGPDPHGTLDSMTPGAARFTVDVREIGTGTVVAPIGELDHDTAPLLRERLDEVFAAVRPSSTVVIDCAELGFCDSTGLNVMLTARLQAQESGVGLRLAALRGHVVRMFEITGADGVFSIHPDLADALAAG